MEEKFLKFMQNKSLSENTYNSYARDVRLFKSYYIESYGETLGKLVHADVKMYASFLYKQNFSAKTINRKIAALKQYNLFLVDEGVQDDIVILDKDYTKVQQTMVNKKVPTQQEINKLKHYTAIDNKNAKRDYCFILICIYGGLRESEVVNIRLVDILLDDRFLNIVGKGNKFRQVVINSEMYDAIKEYLEEREKVITNNPYLFLGNKNKSTEEPLSRNFGNRLLNKYKDICNIGKLHPHLLRSYFCTNALYNAGYSIEQVANQAGHSSLNTTKRYIRSNEEDLVTLSNKL